MNEMKRRLFLGAAAASMAALPGLANAAGPTPGSVKIIGIVGSLRKGKSTFKAVELALQSAKTVNPAIATDIIELSGSTWTLTSRSAPKALTGRMISQACARSWWLLTCLAS